MEDLSQKALQMRIDGNSYYQIAQALKITVEEAKGLCDEAMLALQALETNDLESRRLVEITRLDKLRKVLYAQAMKGDIKAASEYDKLSKRYDQLVGLSVSGAKSKEPPKSAELIGEGAKEAVAGVDDSTLERMRSLALVKNAKPQ